MWAPLKSPAATIASTITPVSSITAPVVAPAWSPVIPAASPALWPLETRARIASDTRRITPNELFGRCVRVARTARFARQQHDVLFDDRLAGSHFRRGGFVPFRLAGLANLFAIECRLRRFDYFLMFFLLLTVFFLTVFAIFLRFPLVLLFLGFLFAVLLFMLGFFDKLFLAQVVLGVVHSFASTLVKRLMKVAVPPVSFIIEYRAAHVGIRLGSRLGFFVLCFHQSRRKRGKFFLAEAGSLAVMRFGLNFLVLFFVALFRARRILLRSFRRSRCCLCWLSFAAAGRFAFRFSVR